MRVGAHTLFREFTALCQPCPAKGEGLEDRERKALPGFSRGAVALPRIRLPPVWPVVCAETPSTREVSALQLSSGATGTIAVSQVNHSDPS